MDYSAYNLTISSEIPLALPLSLSADQPDISITIGESEEPGSLSRTYDKVWYAHGDDDIYLRWDNIGSYFIQGGKSITVSFPDGQTMAEPVILAPLLGTVMAVAMYQMGMAALHGSSVVVDNKAVIFLGDKGEGKSTMAGYFKNQGHKLMSDDVCAIDMQKNIPLIHPSFPVIKLWPESMEYLDYTPEKHEKVHPGFEKRNISIDSGFSDKSSNVNAIIVLATGPSVKCEAITGHQAVPVLLPHLIINRFPENQPDNLIRNIYFQLIKLIKITKIYRLTRPRDISLLPSLYKIVTNITQ